MSRLRAALEQRSLVDVPAWGPPVKGRPAGYGVPGQGYWDTGMVWRSGSTMAADADSAMRLSAVFACLRVLSEAISTLPVDTFVRDGGTRRPYRPRPAYLSFDPPQQSRIEYLSMVMLSLLTDGNAFVATPRDAMGVPVNLVPLDPGKVEVERHGGAVMFRIGSDWFSALDILHIRGMSMPGELRGVSPIAAARDVLSGAMQAQDFGESMFRNGAVPPAVIEVPDTPDDASNTKAKRIAATWNETHGGTANAGKVGVLVGGASLKSVAVTPEDAQWLETRRFGVQEIARIFGVPPHLIADSSNSTSWGSGLAEQNLAFGQLSLRPWIERIEEAHGRLLTSHGLGDVFIRLNLDALLRASLSDRYESYAVGIENRFLYPNEARRLEDLPPIPGGDEFPPAAPGGAQ